MQAQSNILLNPSEERYIDQQINRLSRFFPTDDDLPFMDIVITGNHHQPCINATIFLDDATLTSHQEETTTRRAVEAAFRDLDGQIRQWQADKKHRTAVRQNVHSRRAITF